MVLASASFWSTLLLRSSEAAACGGRDGVHRHPAVYGGLLKYFAFFAALRAALFALGNMVHYFLLALYQAVLCPVFECCMWSAESWILREMPWCSGAQCLARLWPHVLSDCCDWIYRETLWLLPQCLARQWIHFLHQYLAFERNFAHFLRGRGLES